MTFLKFLYLKTFINHKIMIKRSFNEVYSIMIFINDMINYCCKFLTIFTSNLLNDF